MENKEKEYTVKFGIVTLEGSFDFIIKKMYCVYGKSLSQIRTALNNKMSRQGIAYRLDRMGCTKRNLLLENKNLFYLSNEEIREKYEFSMFSIRNARKKVKMTKRECCKHPISIYKRRIKFINFLFGDTYAEGRFFLSEFGKIIDSFQTTDKIKKLLIDYYVTGIKLNNNQRASKFSVLKRLKKYVNQKDKKYYIKNKFIKEI